MNSLLIFMSQEGLQQVLVQRVTLTISNTIFCDLFAMFTSQLGNPLWWMGPTTNNRFGFKIVSVAGYTSYFCNNHTQFMKLRDLLKKKTRNWLSCSHPFALFSATTAVMLRWFTLNRSVGRTLCNKNKVLPIVPWIIV